MVDEMKWLDAKDQVKRLVELQTMEGLVEVHLRMARPRIMVVVEKCQLPYGRVVVFDHFS